MYNDILVGRYKLHPNVAKDFSPTEDFDLIDGYKNNIKPHIFTGIKMTDYTEGIEKAFQSRLQIILSSTLLRSILLKNGVVLALNDSNFPVFYATLKSFIEIPALLGYIVHLIYNKSDYEKDILPVLVRIFMGTKPAGGLSIGSTEAINVMTMFEKLDRVIKDIGTDGKTKKEAEEILKGENVLTTFYSDVCNYGHPNWSAHLSIGILDREGIWNAKANSEGYKCELYGSYMIPLTVCIQTIEMLCSMILRNDKVRSFDLLSNKLMFSD